MNVAVFMGIGDPLPNRVAQASATNHARKAMVGRCEGRSGVDSSTHLVDQRRIAKGQEDVVGSGSNPGRGKSGSG